MILLSGWGVMGSVTDGSMLLACTYQISSIKMLLIEENGFVIDQIVISEKK